MKNRCSSSVPFSIFIFLPLLYMSLKYNDRLRHK